jgi:hypothetical protein
MWPDVVRWRSRAEEAAREINSAPECAAWFRYIPESGGLRHVEVVAGWTVDSPWVQTRLRLAAPSRGGAARPSFKVA